MHCCNVGKNGVDPMSISPDNPKLRELCSVDIAPLQPCRGRELSVSCVSRGQDWQKETGNS